VKHVSMVISTNKSGFSLYLLILVTQSGMRYRFSGPATKTTFRHSDLSGSSFVQIEVMPWTSHCASRSMQQITTLDTTTGWVDIQGSHFFPRAVSLGARSLFAGSQSVSVSKELGGV
jgi:hypothetical protein